MMKKKKMIISAIVGLCIAALILPNMADAQDLPPILPDKPTQTPIDGGLGLLAAAGGAYAIKKIRDKKK